MEFFGKAKEQFLKFNFKESLENIFQSFKFESLPKPAEEELLALLQQLFVEKNNRVEFFDEFFKIGELYFENKNYPRALRVFDGLRPYCIDNDLERILFYIFFSASYVGQIKYSKKIARQLLNLRYKMKYLGRGLELVEHIKSFNISIKLVQEYSLKFALLKKDIRTFNLAANHLGLDFASDQFWSYCLEVEEKTCLDANDWMVSKYYLQMSIVHNLSKLINENISDPVARKKIIYLIYHYKVRYPTDLFIYPLLLEYAVFYKRGSLEQAISSYFVRNPNKFKKNKTVKTRMLNLLNGSRNSLKIETMKLEAVPSVKKTNEKLDLKIKIDPKFKEFTAVSERVMIKTIDLLEEDIIVKFYNDFVVCFAVMEFYETALFILNKVENVLGEKIKIKDSLNIDYLRIDFFIKLGRYHEALTMAEDAAFYKPCFLKEKLGFLYLKAEILTRIGKLQEAEGIYRLIKGKYPNFRLVKGKLREIENLK